MPVWFGTQVSRSAACVAVATTALGETTTTDKSTGTAKRRALVLSVQIRKIGLLTMTCTDIYLS
jgi:hypothetical protein